MVHKSIQAISFQLGVEDDSMKLGIDEAQFPHLLSHLEICIKINLIFLNSKFYLECWHQVPHLQQSRDGLRKDGIVWKLVRRPENRAVHF